MLKIGLFTFGGGYAMISLLEGEFVEKKKYLDSDEFLDMVAIAESTPGPIAINAATYIGYKRAGVLGSVFSTVGVCVPSFVIIYVISLFLDGLLTYPIVEAAFRGIQVCVVYLIFSAGIKLLTKMKKTPLSIGIMLTVGVFVILLSIFNLKISSIIFILLAGALGLVSGYVFRKENEK